MPLRIADPSYRNVVGQFQTKDAVAMTDRPSTRYIVIHHAAATYQLGKACESIWFYHRSLWVKYGRIGYHEVIQAETDFSLRCYGVNPVNMQGAGVKDRNHECFHICAATHFLNTVPLQVWIDALALRVAEAMKRWPQAEVVGHREIALPVSPTTCPGEKWMLWKQQLIETARRLIGPALMRAKGTPVWQRRDCQGALAGFLGEGDIVAVDVDYQDGIVHLASGLGFTKKAFLE